MEKIYGRKEEGRKGGRTLKMRIIGIDILLLLILLLTTTGFTQQAMAKPQYLVALRFVYGDGSCTSCHIDQNGGKLLNDYGTKFGAQPIHIKDSVLALRAIGDPNNSTLIISKVTKTPTTTSIAVTSAVIATVPVVPSEKSPGFGVIFTMIFILIIYVLRIRQ